MRSYLNCRHIEQTSRTKENLTVLWNLIHLSDTWVEKTVCTLLLFGLLFDFYNSFRSLLKGASSLELSYWTRGISLWNNYFLINPLCFLYVILYWSFSHLRWLLGFSKCYFILVFYRYFILRLFWTYCQRFFQSLFVLIKSFE